ncbi:hypothetical protein D3C76_997120 [compost metagenome]
MPCANGLAQGGYGFDGLAGLTRRRWHKLQQRAQGLPGIAVQRHGAGVEVVELARVDVHP